MQSHFKEDLEVPFYEETGKFASSPRRSWKRTIIYKDNQIFHDRLHFSGIEKSNSGSDYYTFSSFITGQEYSFLGYDFRNIIPHMVRGVVTGNFFYVKRGAYYSIAMVPPEEKGKKNGNRKK